MRVIRLGIILLTLSIRAFAEDIYIAQTSQGGDSGVDAANAHSAAWFNTAGNWGAGAGKISPGDTVRLCGILTTGLTVQGDGSSGNLITIHGETGSKFYGATVPNPCVGIGAHSYVTVDGVWVECTANGNAFANKVAITAISASGGSYITVQNCVVTNLFVRTFGSSDASDGGTGVRCFNCSHIIVRSNAVHYAACGIALGRNGATLMDWQIYSNTIYGCNFGVQGYDGANAVVSDVRLYGNRIDGGYLWDGGGTVPDAYHHNGIYMWAENSGSKMSDVFVYGNIIGPKMGTAGQATAELFFSCSATVGAISNLWLYNNVLFLTNGHQTMDGVIFIWGPQKVRVLNNSIYCATTSDGVRVFNGSDVQIINNIIAAANSGPIYDDGTTAISVCDSNLYSGGTGIYYANTWTTFASWQARGYDANSTFADPLYVNAGAGNLTISANSPAIGRGANLYGDFQVDSTGVARPVTGAWDIGAFQYGSQATPNPPATSFINAANVGTLRFSK